MVQVLGFFMNQNQWNNIMDFSKFDTRTAAETARPLHLRHQFDGPSGEKAGDPINTPDGLPCLVWIKGNASRSIQSAIREEQRVALLEAKKAKGSNNETRAMEDLHEGTIKSAARFIDRFENIDGGSGPLESTEDDKRWFLDLTFFSLDFLMNQGKEDDSDRWKHPSFAQQILHETIKGEAFLDNSSRA